MLPLQKTILYSNVTYPNRYWTYPHNATEWNVFMTELTTTANKLQLLMLKDGAQSLGDAHIGENSRFWHLSDTYSTEGYFDSHGLFLDIIANPENYLNGTAPLNVTFPIKSCVFAINETVADPGNCTIVNGTDRDSYLW